jgi:hypothetical protein
MAKVIKDLLGGATATDASTHVSADESPPGTSPDDHPSAMWTETVTEAVDFLGTKAIDFRGPVS